MEGYLQQISTAWIYDFFSKGRANESTEATDTKTFPGSKRPAKGQASNAQSSCTEHLPMRQ